MPHTPRELLKGSLSTHLPFIWRLAVAFTPTQNDATRVLRHITRLAGEASLEWTDMDEATRWLRHHTILELRDADKPDRDDPLTRDDDSPSHRATIAAFRKLPRQQQEATLLSAGASLTDRQIGIAMDCSVTAASGHRTAAIDALKVLSGSSETPLRQLAHAFGRIDVPGSFVVEIEQQVDRIGWWRTVWPWIALVGLLLVVAVATWLILTRIEI
ncbi:MAG: hypothetical protein AAF561_03220 [Planctomycetota bacterium]